MRVLISGATGFIGGALAAGLRERGHEVVALTRSAAGGAAAIYWDPMECELDAASLALLPKPFAERRHAIRGRCHVPPPSRRIDLFFWRLHGTV